MRFLIWETTDNNRTIATLMMIPESDKEEDMINRLFTSRRLILESDNKSMEVQAIA